jgi:hypothetical protein
VPQFRHAATIRDRFDNMIPSNSTIQFDTNTLFPTLIYIVPTSPTLAGMMSVDCGLS